MNDNEKSKPKVYPEQDNPPRPTYEANLRGVTIGGWLYYTDNQINTVVSVIGQRVAAEDFNFTDPESRQLARLKAKNLWRNVVLAVLAGV